LSGDDIPLGARIVFAVDAFHAMTSDRPYRRAMTHRRARQELERHAGTQFDPGVVRVLLQSLDDEVP
jgi:HD-GYP domain-containing protein (c-di-GMP phosphodiesterase class II)